MVKHKKRKYAPRLGIVCPKCGEGMRTVFVSLNEGGFRALPSAGGCPKCLSVYNYNIVKAPEIVKKVA